MLPLTALALVLAADPQVAVLSSRGAEGELRFQPASAQEVVAPAVRFAHAEGSPVLGSLLPGTRVVVATAVMKERGDLSFASALLRLEAGKPARVLADGVVYGSRPHVTAEGRVFVARGVAGAELSEQGRVDALVIDEVNATTGKARTVYASRGFVTYIGGSIGRELVVYELTTHGARLLAVHVDTLAVRVLLPSMVALARDFFVDAPRRRVLFTQGTPHEDAWFVEALQLDTRERTVIARSNEPRLLASVSPDGALFVNEAPRVEAGRLGYWRVQLARKDLVLALHEVPGEFPSAFVSGRRLATPPDARLDLAGATP